MCYLFCLPSEPEPLLRYEMISRMKNRSCLIVATENGKRRKILPQVSENVAKLICLIVWNQIPLSLPIRHTWVNVDSFHRELGTQIQVIRGQAHWAVV